MCTGEIRETSDRKTRNQPQPAAELRAARLRQARRFGEIAAQRHPNQTSFRLRVPELLSVPLVKPFALLNARHKLHATVKKRCSKRSRASSDAAVL